MIAMQLKAELQSRITAAIQLGQDEVAAAAGLAAGEIGTQQLSLAGWQPPNPLPSNTGSSDAATPMSNGTGGAPAPAAPAPAVPVSGGDGVQNVKYTVGDSGETNTTELAANTGQNGVNAGGGNQNAPRVEQTAATDGTNRTGTPSPGSSSPLQSSSGGSGSLIGHMMSPLSSAGGGSPASAGGSPLSSLGSGLGNFGNPAARILLQRKALLSLTRVMGPPDCQEDGTTVARY